MAIGGTFAFSVMITVSWPVDTPPSMSATWYLIVVTPAVVGAVNVITLPRLVAVPREGAVDDTTVSGLFDPSGSESLLVTSFDPIAPTSTVSVSSTAIGGSLIRSGSRTEMMIDAPARRSTGVGDLVRAAERTDLIRRRVVADLGVGGHDRAATAGTSGVPDECRPFAAGVTVVAQHVDRHGRVHERGRRVVAGVGRSGQGLAEDRHADVGGDLVVVPVGDRVREARVGVVAIADRGRRELHLAADDHGLAEVVRWLRHSDDHQRVTVGIDVVGQHVDGDG